MANIITLDQFLAKRDTLASPIILTGGCFDILHIGHIHFFEELQKIKGQIIVLLESDATVKKLKGIDRPIHTQQERAKILSYLPMVDTIIMLDPLLSHESYYRLVNLIKPDIIATTKGDPLKEVKSDQAQENNAKLVEIPRFASGKSTSEIAKILQKEI